MYGTTDFSAGSDQGRQSSIGDCLMRFVIPIILSLALSACGGGSDEYSDVEDYNGADYEDTVDDSGRTFGGYECTDDCSGHEAGYSWAEQNGIGDPGDCGGNSQSFVEGCRSYAEENDY